MPSSPDCVATRASVKMQAATMNAGMLYIYFASLFCALRRALNARWRYAELHRSEQ